ncbi:tape measure protein [Hymenobacter sp. HSC-4F20]|uniref:tape measure protein n=1 Tax=Hymenobacter sp. HSC-4F20 TaxID=2864135 RepID=UPI001C73A1ED|nr:tape measure protein [Hymenobacter sp. HSC-4F20]MBX0289726.1 tape measure protein [Hymenobacter sp. HSC-4F20]
MTTDVGIVVGIKADDSGARIIKRSLDDVASTSRKAVNENQRLEQQIRSTTSAAQGLGNAFKAMAAAYGVREIIRTADQFTVMEARINGITKSTRETTRVMGELRKISSDTGSEMETSLSILQRLSFVRSEIKATNNDMLAFTETVTKLGVTSGALPEAMKAGLTQLGQALSSQYTRAEEFNSIMENIPAVGKAIADQLGVTTGQMRLLVVEGKLLSSDVFAALLNQTEKVRAEFEQFPKTASQGAKQMASSFEQVIAQANAATGATNGIGMALRVVGEGAKAIYDGLGTTFDYLVAGIQEGVNLIDIAINKVKQSINDVSRLIPGYDGTSFSLSPTVEVGSVFSAANAARKAREKGLFGDDFASVITPNKRAISQDYAQIAAGLGGDKKAAREAEKARKKAEREALKEQKELQNDLDDAVKSSRNEYEKLYDRMAEMERLKPLAKTAEQTEAITKNIANAREELDKLRVQAELDSPAGKTFQRFAKSIDDSFSDAWRNAFSLDKNGSIFKRMLDGIKGMFVNFLADLSYQALIRPIVVSLIGAGAGAAGISSGAQASVLGTGTSGISNGFSLASAGSSLLGVGKSLLAGGSITGGLGQFAGKASAFLGGNFSQNLAVQKFFTNAGTLGNLAGGFAGGIGANLLGLGNKNPYVNAATGTIGGLIGSVGGPLGAAAGSFLGTALGGLFGGKKPSDMSQTGVINLSNLGTYKEGMTGKKFSQQNADFRDSILNEVSSLANLLKSVGGQLSGNVGFTVGNRDGLRLQGVGNFGTNSQAFIAAIMQKVLDSTTGLSETFQKIVKVVGPNTGSLSEAFTFGQWYDSLGKTVDPLKEPMQALNDQFDTMFGWANKLGFPLEKINAEYAKQKTALEGNIKAQQAGFSSFEQLTAAFDGFFTGQVLGTNSSLNPLQKLNVAQSGFDSLLKKAQGGDLSVTPDLLASANTLLGVGRDVYASGADFSGLEGFVKSSVQSVAKQTGYSGQNVASSIISTNQSVVEEIRAMREDIGRLVAENFRLSNKLAAAA